MKVGNELLKQLRICSGKSVEEFAKESNFSVGYIRRLEADEVNNLEYIYPRYAKALGIREKLLKEIALKAIRQEWNHEKIVVTAKKMMRISE